MTKYKEECINKLIIQYLKRHQHTKYHTFKDYTSRYPRALHGAGSRKYNMSYDCTWKEKISTIRLVKLVIYEFLLANGD